METNIISFKHSCFSGDLIYALASVKTLCSVKGHKAHIHQWLNVPGRSYDGANHPYNGVMMNEYAFRMMKPLLEAQDYIHAFDQWTGQATQIDLDKFRQVKNHMPYGNIVTWIAMCAPEMTPRYWEPWLKAPRDNWYGNKIVINRTSRYHAHYVDYFFLREHKHSILFVGTPQEHRDFENEWGFKVVHEKVKDFLELATVINSCKLFIGNQSMCFAIAEALKSPRLLEVCDFAPNVTPAGEGGYYFRHPELFKYHVNKLLK